MASEQGERRATGAEAAYEGNAGRTRTEVVQVWMPDGQIRALPVYVGIDAAADEGLAALARAGTLHHVAEGVVLAIPFVYHDPGRRVFVLVVPDVLRHRALAARAELLAAIAVDSTHHVPDYVRDAEVAIGATGLIARLEAGRPGLRAVPSDGAAHAARENALLTRERELTLRERLVSAREQALRAAPAVYDSELEEVDGDVVAYERAVMAAELEGADDLSDVENADDAVEEIEDVDDFADPPLAEADDAGYDDVPAVLLEDNGRISDTYQTTISPAPSDFATDASMQLSLSARAGQAWLYVRGRPPVLREGSDIELLVQVDPDAGVPIAMVTLVFDANGAQEVRRGVIDPWDPDQMEALRLLGQQFAVELVSWSPDGTLDHWATLQTPREANARAIVAALEAYGEPDPGAWALACQALMASPPPWRDLTHPFQLGESPEPPLTATEAAVLVDELNHWLAPERHERLRLQLCVPDEVIRERTAQLLGYALDWGLSLPGPLAARALELGLAQDEAALLLRRIEGLTRTSKEPDFGGMEESVLHALWADALEQAARLGVSLPDAAHDAAKLHGGERAQLHAEALAEPHDEVLERLREQARAEPPEAAVLDELSLRGGYRDLLHVCRASEQLSAEAAARLFSRVARRGDPVAVDALLALLSGAEPLRVRAGAALALAERHAVNAIDELARHVAGEGAEDWPLFALALGRYGGGSFRAIARALTEREVPSERAEHVLAHLALHGARSQLRAKTRVQDPQEAALAERALALAGALKGPGKQDSNLEPLGSLTVFCQLFDHSQRDAV